MRKKAGALILLVGVSISSVLGGSIELAGEGFIPEPNQEITVQIQTDTPLFAMGIGIYVIGDANITAAMSEADCNEFGWDNGWNSDPYIDPNGWVEIVGVRWDADANGTVGYFKFRYNSGQVTVSIDEDSVAYDANCEPVPFSDKTLVFGLPDPNDCNEQGEPSSQDIVPDENTPTSTEDPNDCNEQGEPPSQDIIPDENTPASTEDPNDCNEQGEPSSQDIIPDENTPASAEGPNDINIPFNNYRQDKEAERQKRLRYFPADFNSSREELSRAEWEGQLEKDGGGQMLMGGEPNVIDVNSDITSNQIWTENNIYRVTADVNVTALLVIEPGTVISFNNHGSLFINNGGALISCGTPDEPIYYTSAYIDPYPGNYYYAIYVEETASPATKIAYSYIEYAYLGVVTDNIRLDTPIENNIFFDNKYGVYEYGTHHSDIINNLVYDSTGGIDVNMGSSSGEADINSHILIGNNTCHDNSCFGIKVHGTMDANNAGQVTLVNNIVSSSQTGIALVNGWMYPVVTNTGYYANITNINDFNDTNSVEVNEGPYVDGQNIFEVCYLKQDCPFIDAGWGYVEETAMIGMTTDYYNSLPDSNKVDIGFHHPNWDYAENYLIWLWDFDDSGQIDISDFQVFAEYWLNPFDFYDFASFASQYGQTSQQLTPDIQMVFNQDTNSLKGFVQIGVDVFDPNMNRLFVLMDGEKYSEIFDLDNLTTGVQTGTFANGKHSFKVVRLKNNGDIICSGPYDVNFSNEISCITADSGYSSDRGYCFYAFGSVGENYNAEIRNLVNDNIVYTSNFNDNIGVRAAASVFTEPYHIYSVTVTDANSDEIAKKIMGRRFNPNVIDGGVKMAVTIGSEDVNTWGNLDNIVPAVIKAAVGQELNPQYLPYEDCTWKNLSRLLKDYPNVTYWYHIGHGSYKIPVVSHSDPNLSVNVRRTWIGIKDNMVFSRLKKDYGAGVPPNYQDLGSWESYASIAELGFESNPKLEYVRIYSCYSAKYPDFAVAAGIINDIYYNPLGDRIYIGWKNAAYPGDWNWKWGIVPIPIYYKTFEVSWFYQQGVGYSVGKAVTEAIMAQPLVIRCILWNGLYPNIGFWGANEFYFWFGQ